MSEEGQSTQKTPPPARGFSHDYVVIPLSLYNRLASRGDQSEPANSDGQFVIPSVVLDAMRAGETAVLAWRKHRNLRQKELAAAVSLTPAAVCLIEQARPDGSHRSPKLPTLLALARALGIPDEYRWILKPASRAKLLD